jgi:hypothetical protein
MRFTFPVAVLAVALCVAPLVAAQDQAAKDNLTKLLQSQYVLTKSSPDNVNVITAGTVLLIQKDGMVGDGQGGVHIVYTPNKYQNGQFKHGIVGALVSRGGGTERTFQLNERVYLLKLEIKDSEVVFNVLSCDPIDGVRYASSVAFQFGKGYLASAGDVVSRVQNTIGQVFTVESGDAGTAQEQPAGQQQQQMAPIAPPARPADQPQPAIELGQTTDQVVAIMGQPQKVVKVGTKQIYIYKDLKVTFKDGKVSDVQ